MNFLNYVGKRVGFSALVIFFILIVVWFMVNLVGDPARLLIPAEASEQLYLDMRLKLGLEDPILVRLWRDMSGWLLGDFGSSLWQNVPAMPLVLSRLPDTLILTFFTLSFVVPLAVLLGIFSALRPNSLLDRFLTTVSLAGVSIADFWLGRLAVSCPTGHRAGDAANRSNRPGDKILACRGDEEALHHYSPRSRNE